MLAQTIQATSENRSFAPHEGALAKTQRQRFARHMDENWRA